MVSEGKGGTAKASDHVKIGSLCRERERERSEGGLTIQSGAPHARAGQEVGDGFQAL